LFNSLLNPGVTKGYYTGDSSYSIAYLSLLRKQGFSPPDGADLKALADQQFEVAFEHIDTNYFFVWHETVEGGHVNFVTGAGGFLQNIIYGYGGVLADASGLLIDSPLLPNLGITSMKFRGMQYCGSAFSLSFDDTHMSIALTDGLLYVYVYTYKSGGSGGSGAELEYLTALTAAEGENTLVLSTQKILLTAVPLDTESSTSGDDDVTKFFKDYLPYIIVGSFLLVVGCAYLAYKWLFSRPADDLAQSLNPQGKEHTRDSKL
jgi:hypothetical protein